MRIVIIGNGISGVTAARFIRKRSDHDITIVSAETAYFYSRTALMYIYMGHMRFKDTQPYEPWFWKKNRIDLLQDQVVRIDPIHKTIHLKSNPALPYDKLIVATGSKSNKFGWPGQDLEGVCGLYSFQDLEYMESHSKNLQRAVIVGGGLIGIEMAEMFHSRNIPVTMLVRENSYWNTILPEEESAMINRHIREYGIDLRLSTELRSIEDDGTGHVKRVITSAGETITCGYVGLTAGVSPNIDLATDAGIETRKGILVNDYLETSIPDIYAVGDCVELRQARPGRRAIEAVWYVGRMMGETVAYNVLGGALAYDPGVWFNSAKFFDIEYQVYGDVPASPDSHHVSLYWEHPDGKKSIRIVYHQESGAVLGFNLMGVRYRHEVCDQWITGGTHIEEVLTSLGLANFDPEFYEQHESEIVALYNRQAGRTLSLKQKRGLDAVLQWLH